MRNRGIAEMVVGFLTDAEVMTDKLREQITKACQRNCYLTSCYSLQVAKVQDIHGRDSKTSGWYIMLEGTRSGVNFFVNNDMEVTRKPNKNTVRVAYEYSLYNDNMFDEGFWCKNFARG